MNINNNQIQLFLSMIIFILSLYLFIREYKKKSSSEHFAGMMTAYAVPTLNVK